MIFAWRIGQPRERRTENLNSVNEHEADEDTDDRLERAVAILLSDEQGGGSGLMAALHARFLSGLRQRIRSIRLGQSQFSITLLAIYWLAAGGSLVWHPLAVEGSPRVSLLRVALAVGLLAAGLPLIHGSMRLLRRRASQEWCLLGAGLVALATVFAVILLMETFVLRQAFAAAVTALCVAVHLFAIHLEEPLPIREMHQRYLEYARTFAWVLIFATIGYLSWEISAIARSPGERFFPELWPVSFIQLAVVVGGGGSVAGYGLHLKMTKIEHLLLGSGSGT